jgi:hypothetical protein
MSVDECYGRLLADPPLRGDYIYESCRQASLIMLHAIKTSQGLAEADYSMIRKLLTALSYTDIARYWLDMRGDLSWISLVGLAACTRRPEFSYMSPTFADIAVEVCVRGKSFRETLMPVTVFTKVQSIIRSGKLFADDSGRVGMKA